MSDLQTESAAAGQTPARLIRWLAAVGALVVLLVTTTSALLRVTNAGLGCEDWPACYGRAASGGDPVHPPRFARLLHRVAAATAGGVVLGIGLLALMQPRRHRRELAVFGILALLTLGLATLGRATPGAHVPAVAMGNVLGGMLTASLLTWLALERHGGDRRAPARLRGLSILALTLVFLTIGLGVMTSASYSGLACPALPSCTMQGSMAEWFPSDLDPWRTSAASRTIHMTHRVTAVIAGAVTLALAWSLGRFSRAGRRLRTLLLAALALQFLLGIALVKFGLPLPVAILHNLGAALLFLALVATQHELAGARRSEALPAAGS